MTEFIKKIDDNKLMVRVSSKIYSIKAITNATHKFTNKFYANINTGTDDMIVIGLSPKDKNALPQGIAETLINEIIEQQVRVNIESDFGVIREEIVKKAFSPIL